MVLEIHDPGPIQDSVKMGALLSFIAGGLAFLVAWIVRIKPISAEEKLLPDGAPSLDEGGQGDSDLTPDDEQGSGAY